MIMAVAKSSARLTDAIKSGIKIGTIALIFLAIDLLFSEDPRAFWASLIVEIS